MTNELGRSRRWSGVTGRLSRGHHNAPGLSEGVGAIDRSMPRREAVGVPSRTAPEPHDGQLPGKGVGAASSSYLPHCGQCVATRAVELSLVPALSMRGLGKHCAQSRVDTDHTRG